MGAVTAASALTVHAIAILVLPVLTVRKLHVLRIATTTMARARKVTALAFHNIVENLVAYCGAPKTVPIMEHAVMMGNANAIQTGWERHVTS